MNQKELARAELSPVFPEQLPTLPIERMKELPIFAGIPETTLKKLQPNILSKSFEGGELIIREGDYSDTAYYIVSGVVQVVVRNVPSGTMLPVAKVKKKKGPETMPERAEELAKKSAADRGIGRPSPLSGTLILTDIPADVLAGQRVVLEKGELFGEISALSRYPVSATIKAESRTECVLIRTPALRMMQRSSKSFKEYVDTRYKERTLKSHLANVPLFASCDISFLEKLKTKVELVSFEPGEVIVEQGSPADAFYLVRGGYVKVGLRMGGSDLAVTYLRKGDFAGEAALLLDEPWPFTLEALEHVEVVKLSRESFQEAVSTFPALERSLWEQTVKSLKERGRVARDPNSAELLQMAMETGLIHGESVLLIDLETCTRCDDCVRGCQETHGGTPRFIREGMKYKNWLVPTSCYECTDPVCMIGCPTGAITRPVGTTEVVIDPMTCIGCSNCVRRCPWDNIIEVPYSHPVLKKEIKLATKCDQCFGRDEGPACVQMCPHGSAVRISFKDFVAVAETLER
ncbi:MAG TPA: cyclic nucleotide-binding domain-containing protein [Thermoanaerobaculia bacterium]|nr:cyclic nucleotide-binding domain-containing protein [Thermoanaerobaculia bacterium]